MERAEYMMLKGAAWMLRDAASLFRDDIDKGRKAAKWDTDNMLEYFGIMERYSDVSKMPEYTAIKDAVRKADGAGIFGWKAAGERASDVLDSMSPIVVSYLYEYAKVRKPPADPEIREAVIPITGKYRDGWLKVESTARSMGRGGKLWGPYYSIYAANVRGILGEFKAADNAITYDEGYRMAHKKLGKASEEAGYHTPNFDRAVSLFMDSHPPMEMLIANLKTDLEFTEYDIGETQGVLKGLISDLMKEGGGSKALIGSAEYKPIDVDEIERLIGDISDLVLQSTKLEQGDLKLNVPTPMIRRLYESLGEELRNSQYEDLFDEVIGVTKIIGMFDDDPTPLLGIIKKNTDKVRSKIGIYTRKVERERRIGTLR